MTNEVQIYSKYASLQMASEALLDQFAYTTANGLKAALVFGNNRSSKFTETQAKQFVDVDKWVIMGSGL